MHICVIGGGTVMNTKISERRIRNNKIRRQRQLRKNMLLGTLTICIVCILAITVGGFLSKAKADNEEVYYKYYKSIQIEEGDTLWSLAEENMNGQYKNSNVYIKEVMDMNAMSDDTIVAGEYIVIPYYSVEFVQ